ncbi:MAG: TolC family protein, partial [Proteobacteria bacterium]|nr:TolC family protein [Pseudomonadota bacterium]
MKALQRFTSSTLVMSAVYALCTAAAGTAQAQSLSAMVDQARGYDAAWQAAQAQLQAAGARADQARAGLLPSAALTGGANYTRTDMTRPPLADVRVNSPGQTLGLQATQPLYR